MRTAFRTFVAIISALTTTAADGSETLYDNLAAQHNWSIFVPGRGDNNFAVFAQPFAIGDNNTVDSVSLRLARWDGTTQDVTGLLPFSIWNDNGRGRPGEPVGDLGIVDVAKLPNNKPDVPDFLHTITLDSAVAGLNPGETYYVVGDIRELEGVGDGMDIQKRDSILAPFLPSSSGTNGKPIWTSSEASPADWGFLRNRQPGQRYLQMAVEASTTAFHNLHVETDEYMNALGNDRRFAQQFQMDHNTTLDEVTVSLSRQGVAAGSIDFELWSDNGAGDPAERIAVLGTVGDVSQLPTSHTEWSFSTRVRRLTPEDRYWVVANYGGLESTLDENNSIGWTVVLTNEGTNGAANMNGSTDSATTWLGDLGALFGVDPFKLKMSVVTGGKEPCDLNSDGTCDVEDVSGTPRNSFLRVDLVKGNSRTTNVKAFDINGDGIVDGRDLTFWLADAADFHGYDTPFLPGDSDLNGVVEFADFLAVSENFGTDSRDWAHGNFNGDRKVDFSDFLLLSSNYGTTLSQSNNAAVPEPMAPGLLAVGMVVFAHLTRMNRRKSGSSDTIADLLLVGQPASCHVRCERGRFQVCIVLG